MDVSEKDPIEVRFANAKYALEQIEKGNATGATWRLTFRSGIERSFGSLGEFLGRFPRLVVLLVVVGCVGLSLGLLRARFETDQAELWVEQGGRLEKELDYTKSVLGEGTEASTELLIQVGKDGGSAITRQALLEHLDLVTRVAQDVNVTFGGKRWGYQDLCYIPKAPQTIQYPDLDKMIVALLPCTTPTVLDCFWEGAFVHHREPFQYPLPGTNATFPLNWANLNLLGLFQIFNQSGTVIDDSLKETLALIHTYVGKPCLDSNSPGCQELNLPPLNITKALQADCKMFANVWHSELIISGDEWKSGGPSPAVQTLFTLRGAQDVVDTVRLKLDRNITLDEAEDLLSEWRKEFLKVVYDSEGMHNLTDVHAWSADTTEDVIKRFSSGNEVLLIVGYLLMALFAGVAFINLKSAVKSRVNVGLVGVFLVICAVLAGLGLSALCGLPFNPTTTQVLPFLVLALGVDDMFVLAHAFFHVFDGPNGNQLPLPEVSRRCLEKVGHSITLTSVTNAAGFFLAAIIPIPAMRELALQIGICIIINYFVLLFAFPAYLCIDAGRVRQELCDVLCCGANTASCLRYEDPVSHDSSAQFNKTESTVQMTIEVSEKQEDRDEGTTLGDRFVRDYYSPFILHPAVQVIVICISLVLVGLSGYFVTTVKDGLDLTEVVPSGTREHDVIVNNIKYFSFSSVTIVHDDSNDFTSPEWQVAALKYHRNFSQVPWILTNKNENQTDVSEPFWLRKMIDYFKGVERRYIDELPHLSSFIGGIILSLGRNPMEPWQVLDTYNDTNAMVDVIPSDLFYSYLTLWVNLDLVFPQTSRPSFRPVPPDWHLGLARLGPVPKSKPLVYAQMPMYASGVKTSTEDIALIKDTRAVIKTGKQNGMSSYPRGTSFTYYEQYINLRENLFLAVGLILVACLIATSVLLLSVWTGVIMVFMLALTAFEVYGFLGLANIQFSAIPCVAVIVSVGASVEFTAPLCLMFVKIAGTRNKRVHYALMYRFIPIFNGSVSTFLGVLMLAFSEFEFIVRYFFLVFLALLVLGTFNGLVLLPVLLSFLGPPPQVVPKENVSKSNGAKNSNGATSPDGSDDIEAIRTQMASPV